MLDSDLQFFRSEVVTTDGTNGGRMSANEIPTGQESNFWQPVFKADRDAGLITDLKMFLKANSEDDTPCQSNNVYIDVPTVADDWIIGWVGTDTDTQADQSAAATKIGVAWLKSDAVATSSTLVVTVEDVSLTTGNDAIYQVGGTIRPTSKATPTSATGNEELKIIDTVSVSGNDITITTTEPLLYSYTVADGSRVCSVYIPANNTVAATDSLVVSTTGTLDMTTNPTLTNKGTVTQVFTLTFTDSSNFLVTGDSLTGLPSGNVGSDYAAPNPNFSGFNYLEIPAINFLGVPAAGDTIVITVSQAAIPMWFKRTVPALSGSLAGNKTVTGWACESL